MSKRPKTGAVLTLLFALLAPLASIARDVDEPDGSAVWLAHLRDCLKNVFSIKASFVQENRAKNRPNGAAWSGTLEVRRGGRYRIAYKTPKPRLIVSDGKTIWAFDRAASVAVSSPADGSILDSLLGFLVGSGTSELFDAVLLGGASHPDEGFGVLDIIPVQKHPYFSSVILTLGGDCPCIRRVLVTYPGGSLTRITLSEIQTNVGMGQRRFQFTPPRGMRVVVP
jgi:outer membrane lipoprotein carrier protein